MFIGWPFEGDIDADLIKPLALFRDDMEKEGIGC